MAISQKLHTKLVQKLILTPSLQQAIKLLHQEMVENPMLEEVPTEELQPVEATQEKQEDKTESKEKGDTWDDQDYEYFFGDYLDDGYRPRTPTEVKELPPIENTLSTGQSLSSHLLWQLSMQTDEPILREIGEAIIGNLDDDGYLVATVEDIAGMGPWSTGDVERALALVQSFDPIGVAARDLQECLLLQLRHLGMGGTPAEDHARAHGRRGKRRDRRPIALGAEHDPGRCVRALHRTSAPRRAAGRQSDGSARFHGAAAVAQAFRPAQRIHGSNVGDH